MAEVNPFSKPGASETGSEVNPYAASSLDATANPVDMDSAEGIRRRHLNHEASVKSIGSMYMIGSAFMAAIALTVMKEAFSRVNAGAFAAGESVGMALFLLILSSAQGAVGYGIRKLRPWGRRAGIAFSVLGLIAIPIGTLISGYFLYLLLSEKGKTVFTEEYKQVIADTPHVKYKTSIVVWIFLGLIVTVVILSIGAAFFSR